MVSMVISKSLIEKIRKIIDKNYNKLTISVLGSSVFNKEELEKLKDQGIDITNKDSFLEMVYQHNFLNPPGTEPSPTSVDGMREQQNVPGVKPEGEAHEYTIESLNMSVKQYTEKLKLEMMTRIEGIIRQTNDEYKMNALQNLDRPEEADQEIKEVSVSKLRQKLLDASGDGTRDWQRVAVTEIGNAIGIGSVDRIVSQNKDKNLNDVYVFRIIVGDDKTCKWCRKFYNDTENIPKLYKLSALLSNGTNYGKKTEDWRPIISCTHPNSRTSGPIELPPGWAILPGGKLKYIGLSKWSEYLKTKLEN